MTAALDKDAQAKKQKEKEEADKKKAQAQIRKMVKDNSLLAINAKNTKKKTVIAPNKKVVKKAPIKKVVKPVVLNKKKPVAAPVKSPRIS